MYLAWQHKECRQPALVCLHVREYQYLKKKTDSEEVSGEDLMCGWRRFILQLYQASVVLLESLGGVHDVRLSTSIKNCAFLEHKPQTVQLQVFTECMRRYNKQLSAT